MTLSVRPHGELTTGKEQAVFGSDSPLQKAYSVHGRFVGDNGVDPKLVIPVTGTVVVGKETASVMTLNGFGRSDYCATLEPSATPHEWDCSTLLISPDGITAEGYPFTQADPLVEPLCSSFVVGG